MENKISQGSLDINGSNVSLYSIMVTVIEASNLIWTGMLTQVSILFGKKTRRTKIKAGTDSPYYNEFFVFKYKGKFNDMINQVLIINVYRPCTLIKRKKLIGSARFDLSTIWIQPDHEIVQKWIVLTHPEEPIGSVKGYLKCSIAVVPSGVPMKKSTVQRFNDKTQAIKNEYFVPESLGSGRLKAMYIMKIYRITGLCQKRMSIFSKKHGSKTPKCYISIYYARLHGSTSKRQLISSECYWNEEITFTEVFPPLFNRVKIDVYLKKKCVCSRFINFREISDPAVKGFLPTYGPAFLHFYNTEYNFMGSLLMSIETKTVINLPKGHKMVSVKRTSTAEILENLYWNVEEFAIVGILFDVSMLPISISKKKKLSLSMCFSEDEKCSTDFCSIWSNLTVKSEQSHYNYADVDMKNKPTLFVKKKFPDLRHRLFISNTLDNVSRKLKKGLEDALSINEHLPEEAKSILRNTLETFQLDCSFILQSEMKAYTNLQKERIKIIYNSLKTAHDVFNMNNFYSYPFNEQFKQAYSIYTTIHKLVKDPQDNFPHIIFKLKSGKRMLGYSKLLAKDILFSADVYEKGQSCGKINSIYFKMKKDSVGIYGRANIFLWFGLFKSIGFALREIPPGCMDLSKITKIPPTIEYYEQSKFLFRAHIYHGRFEPCDDIEGNCKISISVHIGAKSTSSSIIEKTICPVWKETLILDNVYFSGEPAYYKNQPIPVVVQIWNHRSNNLKTLMGRIFCKPEVYLAHELLGNSHPPALKWYKVALGNNTKGEILAIFELIEKKDQQSVVDSKLVKNIPNYIQPKTVKYRLEVLFWGIRNASHKNLPKVDHPKVIVNCGEAVLESQALKNSLNFPNFSKFPAFSTVEIPQNVIFAPPLVIRLFNSKSHGKFQYIGSHTIKNVQEVKVRLVRTDDWMQIGSQISEKQPKKVSFSFSPNYHRKEYCTDNECDTSEMTPLIQNLSLKQQDVSETIEPLFAQKVKQKLSEFASRFGYRQQSVEYQPLKMDAKLIKHPDLNEKYFDWWTKYFDCTDDISNKKSRGNITGEKIRHEGQQTELKKRKKKISKLEVYPCELEKLPIFDGFNDVLRTFDISKRERRIFSAEPKHIVGKFKGAIAVYEHFDDDYVTKTGMDPKWGYFGSLSDEIVDLTVRVYVVRAYQLHNPRRMGNLETYIEIETPSLTITDKDKLISQDYEPVFGKHFEFSVSLHHDYFIMIRVMNGRQLIGETKIDIENRYYSMHRGTCGLQELYHTNGYNAWRDIYRPTEILEWLCLTYNLQSPKYEVDSVKVAKRTFFTSQKKGDKRECLALSVLRNWHTIPIVGCHLLKEHVETRSLFNNSEPGKIRNVG
ncbi:otoferlin-like isoform X2 [Cimex lectularius]|uniref:C2 domain-containing protein n=1 Tax=Cimex lectularius TaxID=79782 RepID=A0A8I6TF25_CIMLE|nr:otoferlin-like isoform X2 [Cimex lectularius]